MITYTITVRRVVEEDIDFRIEAPEGAVNDAIEQALKLAKDECNRPDVIVTVDAIGNVHGSDGSLWI